MGKLIDITGQRFGRWTVTKHSHTQKYGRCTVHYWECICDCGNINTPSGESLKRGKSNSCGCLQIERTSNANSKHGQTQTKVYRVWKTMINRCRNDKVESFKYYGARGITVCDRWKESFEAFRDDMGPRPSDKHSIDRIDVDGNYEPTNCRWATASEQALNKRPKKKAG